MTKKTVTVNDFYADFFFHVLGRMEQTNIKKLKYDFDSEDGYEYGKRLYYVYDNQEYMIRTWNTYRNGVIEYTVFKLVDNHGEELMTSRYFPEGIKQRV